MKKVLFLSFFFLIMPFVSVIAEERFRIDKVLKEISAEQSKSYNSLFVSTYTSYSINGSLISKRYFVTASSPRHNAAAKVKQAEASEHPWLLEIDGRSVYVQFKNDSGLSSGDRGVIKYENDTLYLIVD